MKTIIALLLTTLSLCANDLFLYETTDKIEIAEVIDNKLNVLTTQVGKTYSLSNNPSLNTTSNSMATYMFPHRIAVFQKENSGVYLNPTQIEYNNNFKLPEVIKVKDSLFNLSAQGELYCVSEALKQTTIGTSMGMVVFDKAKLFIKAGDKYTHVYVIEGKATVLDARSSKKKKELKDGDYLVITPALSLNPKETKVVSTGNSFSIKEVEDPEKDLHLAEIKLLQEKLNNVLFVNYGQSIFGVKLK